MPKYLVVNSRGHLDFYVVETESMEAAMKPGVPREAEYVATGVVPNGSKGVLRKVDGDLDLDEMGKRYGLELYVDPVLARGRHVVEAEAEEVNQQWGMLYSTAARVVANWEKGDLAFWVHELEGCLVALRDEYEDEFGAEHPLCRQCQDEVDGDGWDGLCGNCADRAEEPDEEVSDA